MKNLDVYANCDKFFDEMFATSGGNFDIVETLKEGLDNPEKLREFVKTSKMQELQGLAQYSAQFVEELNTLPAKERPYAMIGIEIALKAIYKLLKDEDPIIHDKVRSLRDMSKSCIVAVGGHKDD